jgi:hypothetical protein
LKDAAHKPVSLGRIEEAAAIEQDAASLGPVKSEQQAHGAWFPARRPLPPNL